MDRVIKTEHLNLIALSVDAHRAMLDEEYNRADDIMNINGLADIPLPAGAIEHRLNELIENPKLESQLLRAIVLQDSKKVIGNIGFHSTPDASYLLEQGVEGIEFGYSIIERYRKKGYAREASIGIMDQTTTKHNVQMFVLSIGLENGVSNALARSLGLDIHSNYEHPDRGTEYIYTRQFNTP